MNPQTGTANTLGFDAQSVAPAPLSPTRPMYWSVRRELWENRSIVYAPLIATALVMFGLFVSTMTLPHRLRAIPAGDVVRQHRAIAKPFDFAPVPVILTALLVGVFYCLDALHGERRDRSILFWKSLPVSDRTTLLSKASIPLVVLPVYCFVIIVIAQVVMLALATFVLAASGTNPAILWNAFPLVQQTLILLYGVIVLTLWHAPIYAWLLLVSGWARRATFLWAVLPFAAVIFFEGVTFRTSYFGKFVGYRVGGFFHEAFSVAPKGEIERLSQLTPGTLLISPGLWTGLLAAAAFLIIAARRRRDREPI